MIRSQKYFHDKQKEHYITIGYFILSQCVFYFVFSLVTCTGLAKANRFMEIVYNSADLSTVLIKSFFPLWFWAITHMHLKHSWSLWLFNCPKNVSEKSSPSAGWEHWFVHLFMASEKGEKCSLYIVFLQSRSCDLLHWLILHAKCYFYWLWQSVHWQNSEVLGFGGFCCM